MRHKQYNHDRTLEMTKGVRIDLLIKRRETLIKERRSGPCHNTERIGAKTILSNIDETQRVTIYKGLPRRPTP